VLFFLFYFSTSSGNKFIYFCLNTAITALEKSKFEVPNLLRMRRNTRDAWYEVCWLLVPVLVIWRTCSNCWLPDLKRRCNAWIAAYRGEGAWLFCPCEKNSTARGLARLLCTCNCSQLRQYCRAPRRAQFNARSTKSKIKCTQRNSEQLRTFIAMQQIRAHYAHQRN